MTWKTFHRRGDVLRAVVEVADRRRDGRLPLDVPGVLEAFGDPLTLLGALQLRWHTRLAGRIERELASQPVDLTAAVVAAWRATAEDNPGVRAIIDHHTDEPLDDAMAGVLARSAAKGAAMLAAMAGRSSVAAGAAGTVDPATLRIGREIEAQARAEHAAAGAAAAARASPYASLLGRLRAALAA